jgi:surface protein
MGYMFQYCGALTSLDLSSFNTAKVTEMEYIFYDCSQVTTIYVGSGWINNPDIHANDMFHGCSSLVGGNGTAFDSRYTSYAYAHIDGGTDNPGYFTDKNASYNEAYGVLVIDENNTASLTMYFDANRDAHREGQVIGLDEMMQNQAWMMYRENVTTVVFDSSFANCRPTSTAFWFAYCRSLTSIVGLQYLRTDETTNMSLMFNECSSLTSLDLSSLNTENVTNISGMLGGCRSLTSVDLSGFNTRQVTNMNSLFEQSAALTTINLSSFNTSQVTDMSYMFNECSALTTIYVGSDWSTEAVTNGTDMFNKCTNLVGGAGTTFSADHIDHTYARIDAEGTPGYLTGDGTKPSETVSAPIFAFDGDNLSMTTETANASIFYKMEELPTMDEAYVDSVSNSLIVTPDGQQSTYYERPFELKTSAIVKAIAVIDTQAGTIASDTTTMVYDYAAWLNLRTAIEKGIEIYELAKDTSNVATSLKEQVQWALQAGNML